MANSPTFVALIDDGNKKRYFSTLNTFTQAIAVGHGSGSHFFGPPSIKLFFSIGTSPQVPEHLLQQLLKAAVKEQKSNIYAWDQNPQLRKDFKKRLTHDLQTLLGSAIS